MTVRLALDEATGIGRLRRAPWGSRFCLLYANDEESLELLVPYFRAGLEDGEACVWVTAPPLDAEQAGQGLARAAPDLGERRRSGALEIVPSEDWNVSDGGFDPERSLAAWRSRLMAALNRGCAGLRGADNAIPFDESGWDRWLDYHRAFGAVLRSNPAIALCGVPASRCRALDLAGLLQCSDGALLKRAGRWELVDGTGPGAETTASLEALRESEERCRLALDAGKLGAWRHDLLTNRVHGDARSRAHHGLRSQDVSMDEVIGRIHPDDVARVRSTLATILGPLTGDGRIAIEYRVADPDGSVRWLSVEGRVRFEGQGADRRSVLAIGTTRDVTELKQAEREPVRRCSSALPELAPATRRP
jgi:PAS domain S-box-containing protein